MKNVSMLLLFFLLVPWGWSNPGSEKLDTLDALIGLALNNSPLLKAGSNRLAATEADLSFVKKNHLPDISVMTSFSYWDWLMPNKQKILGDSLSDVYSELSIRQLLYDGHKTRTQKEITTLSLRSIEQAQRSLRQLIIFNVTHYWLEWQKALLAAQIRHNALKRLQGHLDTALLLFDIGKASSTDVLKIKVQMAAEAKAISDAENEAEQKRIILGKWLLSEAPIPTDSRERMASLWENWKDRDFSSTDTLGNLQAHPDIIQTDLKLSTKEKELNLYRADRLPTVNAYALVNWEDDLIPFSRNFNFNVGLGVSYRLPFFKNTQVNDKLNAIKEQRQEMEEIKRQALVDLSSALTGALSDLQAKKKSVTANEEIIGLSLEALESLELRYQAGQGQIMDLLDAQTILTDAETNRIQSMISGLQTIARINLISGQDKYPFSN